LKRNLHRSVSPLNQPFPILTQILNHLTIQQAEVSSAIHQINDFNKLGSQIEMTVTSEGLRIELLESAKSTFFDSGSPELNASGKETLIALAKELGGVPNKISIEGHTDSRPLDRNGGEYSNWELSSARATRIARIFIGLQAIPPDRISAAGYAEFHPTASNNTPEGRAENRRVDLVVLPRTTIDLSASAPPHPTGEWRKITDDDAAAQGATNPAPSNP